VSKVRLNKIQHILNGLCNQSFTAVTENTFRSAQALLRRRILTCRLS